MKALRTGRGMGAERPKSRKERDDRYDGVICQLNARWRVIICRQRIQWILQTAKAEGGHGLVWRGVSYFRTRDALMRVCARLCERIDPAAWAALAALPDVIGTS